jgi:hypothetical protein
MKKPMIGVTVALFAASGASAALAAVPGVTGEGPAAPKVRPRQIGYTADGSGFFAGAQKVSKTNFGSIHWSQWNKKKALGSGGNWLNDCKPYCAAGHFHGYPVTLKLTTPKVVAGKHVFTKMIVTYTNTLPSHAVKTTTWTLKHNKTFFFWKFPANAT